MRGEAVCPLLLCAGPDQPQQPWGEDKVFVAHRRPRAAPASPAPASGTPTEHVLASTGCHPPIISCSFRIQVGFIILPLNIVVVLCKSLSRV